MKKRIQPRYFWPGVFLISISATYLIYLNFIQTSVMSRREIIPFGLWFIGMVPIAYLFLDKILLPSIKNTPVEKIKRYLIVSGAIGLVAIVVLGRPPANIRLLPKVSVTITATGEANPLSSGHRVVLTGFDTRVKDVSYSSFTLNGEWQRVENTLVHVSPEPAEIQWNDRAGNRAVLYFQTGPDCGKITISWNGEEQVLDLYSPEAGDRSVLHKFQIPRWNYILADISIFILAGLLFFTAIHFLLTRPLKPSTLVKQKKYYWLLYAIPMLVVWIFFLFIFWPGMMTPDLMDQWGQIVSGMFDDSHPVAHTLLLWLLTRIWFSPAVIAVFQIIFLSLVTAYGIGVLSSIGLPRWAAWLLTAIFALSPINGSMVVTLWKDIPYSTALFLFSILTIRIVTSNGSWLEGKLSWLWLALSGLLVALFRHNGFPVPIVSLLVFCLFYQRWWKQLLGSLLLLFALWAGIRGVLNQRVIQKETGFYQSVFVHHLAAYAVQPDKLTPGEIQILENIMPIEQWKYICCAIRTTTQAEDFSWDVVAKNGTGLPQTLFELIKRDPKTEVDHLICTSSLVWEVNFRCGIAGMAPFNTHRWIVENPFGLKEASFFPETAAEISRFLLTLRDKSDFRFIWSPGLFLYLGLFCTGIFAVRKRYWKTMLIMLPALVQSGILMLANIAADQFRYQYAIYLLGFLTLGFLVLNPKEEEVEK